MLVKIEARILIFQGTDFHFPSTSVPPGTFLGCGTLPASSTLNVDLLTQYSLRQHVTGPTHISRNTLDLVLSRDKQISEQLVSKVAVQSAWFSDHHLLT